MATLKIVKKWENIFSCELEKVIEGGKVVKLKCKTCSKFENRITSNVFHLIGSLAHHQ